MTCHLCKQEKEVTETLVKIDLGHPTAIELGYTAKVCVGCIKSLEYGIPKAKTAKLCLT